MKIPKKNLSAFKNHWPLYLRHYITNGDVPSCKTTKCSLFFQIRGIIYAFPKSKHLSWSYVIHLREIILIDDS